MDDVTRTRIATEIAKVLPNDVIVEAVSKAMSDALRSLTWGPADIAKLCQQAVAERAKELLQTVFKDQVEAKAQLLAAQAVGEISQYRMRRD